MAEEPAKQLQIGKRIRSMRCKRGMSLKDMSRKTGLTISSLSQIERNLLNPSLNSLIKICSVLEVPVIWLFSEKRPTSRSPVIRKGERVQVVLPHSHARIELLSPASGSIEVFLTRMGPREGPEDEIVSHEGEECVYVLRGQLSVNLGEKTYVVEEGDSIYFQSSIPHRFVNATGQPLEVLVAQYPPSF